MFTTTCELLILAQADQGLIVRAPIYHWITMIHDRPSLTLCQHDPHWTWQTIMKNMAYSISTPMCIFKAYIRFIPKCNDPCLGNAVSTMCLSLCFFVCLWQQYFSVNTSGQDKPVIEHEKSYTMIQVAEHGHQVNLITQSDKHSWMGTYCYQQSQSSANPRERSLRGQVIYTIVITIHQRHDLWSGSDSF